VRECNIVTASYPLAKDQEARIARLRGYGNAIVPQVAAEVIKAYIDCI
jgi:DNA (cytosine-5)-methyltransferase 1